jgi:LysM repeat protein
MQTKFLRAIKSIFQKHQTQLDTQYSLSKIAKANNTTIGNIIRANPNVVKSANLIYPGQKLNIPAGGQSVDKPVAADGVKPTKGSSKGVNTQLPKNGFGYISYYSQNDKFGTAKTISRIQNIAKEWHTRHPDLPVPIGDISRKNGAPYLKGEHASHKKGVDFDMRPFRYDRTGAKVTVNDKKNYNAKATREFVKMVKEMYPKTLIGFNDSELNRSKETQNWKHHDNHLHIRFLD